jgi:transposase-like protein
LKQLTKSVVATVLGEEMTEHLGSAKHDPAGIGADNIGNGARSKTVLSANTGPVEIDVPRDRGGPSSRRSSRNVSAGWARSTRSSCRCTSRA